MITVAKKIILLLMMVSVYPSVAQLRFVDSLSTIGFNVKHFGITTHGQLSGLTGVFVFDIHNLKESKVDVTVSTKTIQTGIELRDMHLRGKDYFDSENFPFIRFASDRIVKSGDGYIMHGKLTIKNRTLDISIPFTRTTILGGSVFKATFTISRKDFDVGGSSVISDSVEVMLNIVARE